MEEWREIEGYEGIYQVSSYGNVRRNGVVLKPMLRPNGYQQVCLCNSGKKSFHKIHRLVAKAFPEICGEWFDGCEINHKDECKTNNMAINLETCDRRYNLVYSNCIKNLNSCNLNPHAGEKAIIAYDKKLNFIGDFPSLTKASNKLGIAVQLISEVLHGKKKSTHGYIFKFKDEVSDTPISSPTPFTSHPTLTNNKEVNYV
jgi:hypothetical protein